VAFGGSRLKSGVEPGGGGEGGLRRPGVLNGQKGLIRRVWIEF